MKTAPSKTIYFIAAFKLFKAVILLLAGLAALKLVHGDIAETLTQWASYIHVDPDGKRAHVFFEKAFNANPKQLKEIAAGTFLYSALILTEGVGLLMRRRWAEYFTIVMTALLIPLEIYEIVEKFTPLRVFFLLLNLGIVWYLIERIRKAKAVE